MKKTFLFFILFISSINAQTSIHKDDIRAVSGNDFETLLTNVEYGLNVGSIEECFNKMDMIHSDFAFSKSVKNVYALGRFEKQILLGNEKQSYVYVKYYFKKIPQYTLPLTTKIEIYGDAQSVIKFYINYWSRELNFNDVKIGEVVSTRFLTDIATLSFPTSNTAKITIISSKDR